MWNCKVTQDAESCWSVWVVCGCCDNGWHWVATCMGENAEERAKDWLNVVRNEV